MKYLQPFILHHSYFKPIEEVIRQEFNEAIYFKLSKIVGDPEYLNSLNNLLELIKRGRITYQDERFSGAFSAKVVFELRRLGAKFDKRSSTYFLPIGDVPADILIAQAEADRKIEGIRKGLFAELSSITPDQFDFSEDIAKSYDHSLNSMEGDFRRAAQSALAVTPEISVAARQEIAQAYTNNLDKYIKGWISETIPKLREQVQQHALSSGRAASLQGLIEHSYNASVNKAKFLARQETSLLMSKYREVRYSDIGVYTYRWSGANDERERPDHRRLNGKIFDFRNPPVTNLKTGARNNPGEDYGCRCNAIGILHQHN